MPKESVQASDTMESVRELYDRPKISPPKAIRIIPQEPVITETAAPKKKSKRRSHCHFKIRF